MESYLGCFNMKKCIHIVDGFYLNLELIATFYFIDDTQIQIGFGIEENAIIIEHDADKKSGRYNQNFIRVNIQELHRIKRELCSFFEIDEPKLK